MSCRNNRDDSRCTLLNETAEQRLIRLILPQRIEFAADAITRLVTPGLYANTRALRKARRQAAESAASSVPKKTASSLDRFRIWMPH